MSRRGAAITAIVLVAVGIVIGGVVGALAAVAAVAVGYWRDYRTVAAVALVALVVAALLTAFEAPATAQPSDYLFDFALDRPLAAQVGRIAGVFVLVAVVLAAIRERAPSSRVHEGGTSG
jgi:membrane protease YdiL (CAAX protease family)